MSSYTPVSWNSPRIESVRYFSITQIFSIMKILNQLVNDLLFLSEYLMGCEVISVNFFGKCKECCC